VTIPATLTNRANRTADHNVGGYDLLAAMVIRRAIEQAQDGNRTAEAVATRRQQALRRRLVVHGAVRRGATSRRVG